MSNKLISEAPVGKALSILGGLGIISMISEGLYGVLDKYFVSVLGIEEVQAVSLVYGITFMIMAVAMWVSIGGMVYLSLAYGNNNSEKVKQGQLAILILATIGGVILNAILYFYSETILSIFTMSSSSKITDDVIILANTYLKVISFSSVPIIGMLSLNFALRSVGFSIIPTLATIISASTNAAFDYYVINYTNLGIAGIGWATVIGFTVAMIFLLIVFIFNWRKNKQVGQKPIFSYLSLESTKSILSFGLPSFGKQIATVTALTVFNLLASQISAKLVAGWGVASDIFTLALYVSYGLNVGMMPLLGYSYGAKDFKRSLKIINITFIASTAIFIIFSILVYNYAYDIMSIYFVDESTIVVGENILQILAISFPTVAIVIHGSNALQIFNKKFASLMVGISRQLIFFIPFVGGIYYVNLKFDTNINIVWGQVMADIIAFALIIKYYYSIILPKLHEEKET